jgi:hypothetical protein
VINQANSESNSKKLISSITMLAALYALTDDSFKLFLGLTNIPKYRFTPSRILDCRILQRVVDESSIASEHPLSPKDYNDYEIAAHSKLIHTMLPSDVKTVLELIDHLEQYLACPHNLSDDLNMLHFLRELSVHECIGYLQHIFSVHELPFLFSSELEDTLAKALQNFNVGEVIGLLWSSIKAQLASLHAGRITEERAAKNVIPNFERILVRAITEKWQLTAFNRPAQIPQSFLSQITYQIVLRSPNNGYGFSIQWFIDTYVQSQNE